VDGHVQSESKQPKDVQSQGGDIRKESVTVSHSNFWGFHVRVLFSTVCRVTVIKKPEILGEILVSYSVS